MAIWRSRSTTQRSTARCSPSIRVQRQNRFSRNSRLLWRRIGSVEVSGVGPRAAGKARARMPAGSRRYKKAKSRSLGRAFVDAQKLLMSMTFARRSGPRDDSRRGRRARANAGWKLALQKRGGAELLPFLLLNVGRTSADWGAGGSRARTRGIRADHA